MAGAWETSPSILIGILHTEQVPTAWALALRHLQIPGSIMPVAGRPFDHARNMICMAALDHGFDFVGMLDSDVIPPPDAFVRLMKHNVPIVSGVYCRRSPPHAVPVMMKGGRWVTQYPRDRLFEVDVVGAGCLVLKCDFLRQFPAIDAVRGRQWFDWRCDMPQGSTDIATSEDFSFCLHAKKTLGVPTLIDPSVECRHIGLAQATLGSFVPCEVAA